jgi:hypothetical protein
LNTFLSDEKNTGASRGSVFSGWMNRRKGFEVLEQFSDGENEPLDNNVADDSNNNSGDETITTGSKQQTTATNNKNTHVTFKMDGSL